MKASFHPLRSRQIQALWSLSNTEAKFRLEVWTKILILDFYPNSRFLIEFSVHSFLECLSLLILVGKVKGNILKKVLIHTIWILISACIATRVRLCRFSTDTETRGLELSYPKTEKGSSASDEVRWSEGSQRNEVFQWCLTYALLHSVLILLDTFQFHLNFFAIIPNLDLLYRASIDLQSLIIQFVGISILVYQ